MQLFKISEELGQQILKIGRVLGPRWAACSLRSALSVWRAYPALYRYFYSEAKHSGMAARLCNKNFLEDLALMIDILQEISLPSNALQARSLTLTKAEQLIKRTIKAFEMLKESKATYEKEIDVGAASDAFKDIHFVENNKVVSLPRQKHLEAVIENMKKRVMNCDSLISKKNEQDDKIHVFHHEISINDFRDYVENVLQNSSDPAKAEVPQSVQKAKNIINAIAVSSAEAERGFSRMNIIYSDKRSRLTVENVANLMIINLIGLPFSSWEPTPSVKTWRRRNHSADDNRVKKKKDKDIDDNQVAIWKYLK
ncbi:E3 SUMO-protein ligase KIAA1586-like [Oratosquilla oratoria]|uniref:E3 SUMO-protein ligase KIAA1586-like n=1 Tax=Oratosquilla oratoria TaxID=337810 RepID=UPI003F762421